MNGKNIVKYRTDNCMSQSELAEKIGVSKSTLSRWENGKSEPRDEEYKRLFEVVGEEYLSGDTNTDKKSAKDELSEMSDRLNDLLYSVSKIESNQARLESQRLKADLFHKRLRTAVIILSCLLVLLLIIWTWFWYMNHGFGGPIIEGPVRFEETS